MPDHATKPPKDADVAYPTAVTSEATWTQLNDGQTTDKRVAQLPNTGDFNTKPSQEIEGPNTTSKAHGVTGSVIIAEPLANNPTEDGLAGGESQVTENGHTSPSIASMELLVSHKQL